MKIVVTDLAAKDRILDAAEKLFAEKSFDGVSLRAITAEAGVNVAAVNYYFGSKDSLLLAVFKRRAQDLNRERLKLLAEVERAAGEAAPPLRDIVHALLAPSIRWNFEREKGLSLFVQFLSRCRAEAKPEMKALVNREVGHLQRFVPPLARALPHLPGEEIFWRLHCALGVMHYTITDLERLESISGGSIDTSDTDAVIEHVVDFATAGFAAPQTGARAQSAA